MDKALLKLLTIKNKILKKYPELNGLIQGEGDEAYLSLWLK